MENFLAVGVDIDGDLTKESCDDVVDDTAGAVDPIGLFSLTVWYTP
jgi:hypothetical protein